MSGAGRREEAGPASSWSWGETMHVPGYDKKLDRNGVLVSTTAYAHFQEELTARFPFLTLAMDREDGLWCICRRDTYLRRQWVGWHEGLRLRYVDEVWTPIMHLEYIKEAVDERGNLRIFLHPGNWVFKVLDRLHPSHLGFDNCARAWQEITEKRRKAKAAQRRAIDQRVRDGVNEWARHVDRSDPRKFKPSVLVTRKLEPATA